MIKHGEVYLTNFGKKYNSEFGKIRPAVIIQNDRANRIIDRVRFKGVTLLPMTTRIASGDLRVLINPRDKLERPSEICINEICTLDLSRINQQKCLTRLNEDELREVYQKLAKHLNLVT